MGLRTFSQLIFEVDRELSDPVKRASTFETQQAINDAYREIVQYSNWQFLIDRLDLRITPVYNTGSVSVTDGSTIVTGNGTNWDTSWHNRKILISGDATDKEIASVDNPTQITLRYPYTTTATVTTGLGYQVYQDQYPINISSSREITIVNPNFQFARLTKWDRYTFNDRTAFTRFQTALRPEVYTDAGTDPIPTSPTYNQPRFEFWPFPASPQDLIVHYYRVPAPLSAPTDTTLLPPEFEEVLIRLAKYRVKRRYGIPGWTDDKTEGMRLLVQFRETHRTSASYDYSQKGPLYPSADPFALDQSLGFWPGSIA